MLPTSAKGSRMTKSHLALFMLFFNLFVICNPAVCRQPASEFMSLDAAQPVLSAFSNSYPAELRKSPDAPAWSAWVIAQDAAIRERLEQGEEDTLTNLLRFGVTYTKEPRIDQEYLGLFGTSQYINAIAETRADDLVRVLSSPKANEGMLQMHAFLIKCGYSFNTSQDRARVKQHLLDNLAHMKEEFLHLTQEKKTAGTDVSKRAHLFSRRGISLDSNLWPDYSLDRTLDELVKNGMLKPGSVRRIAIVGPGLDFANKEYGNDFYPPQSIQPFALLDSLIRLGLTNPKNFQLYTFDISPGINFHLRRVQKNAAAGKSYIVQLPWNSAVPFSPEYLTQFEAYWRKVGERIGTPVKPVHVPLALAQEVHIRAVSIRPEIAKKITPVDMNIVFERLDGGGADQKFDLIIGTNIFVYYGAFEQSLARANLSAMLRPGAFVLTNDLLADKVPSQLREAHRTTIELRKGQIVDHVFCYVRQP